MLWLAIHFPHLPLESISRASCSAEQPGAVVDAAQVIAAGEAARRRGIRPGMRLAAACALWPDLRTSRRNGQAEQDALRSAATWVAQFTPSVAFAGEAQIVLEIEASLRLFGGLDAILDQIRCGLAALGLTGVVAGAPTARGALCLAAAGRPLQAGDLRELAQMLGRLPADTLAADPKTLAMLAAVGVRTLADIEALPRQGFARRFGPELLEDIDRAYGRRAEAHEFFVLPERFDARLELPHLADAAAALLFAAKRLFVQLEAFLRARAAAARCIALRLHHEDLPQTELLIRFVAASRDAGHFAALARERLDRLALPAPVRSISLEVSEMQPYAVHDAGLFPDGGGIPEEWDRLLERLQARLGIDTVHGVAVADDHRPERAGLDAPLAASSPGGGPPRRPGRPLWLLRRPRAIAESNEGLQLDRGAGLDPRGRLTLLAGPERIESGWWDGEDIARDYFIARSEDRALLWIYRQRGGESRWFLHGIFS